MKRILKARKELFEMLDRVSDGSLTPAKQAEMNTAMSLYKTLEKSYTATSWLIVGVLLAHQFFKNFSVHRK